MLRFLKIACVMSILAIACVSGCGGTPQTEEEPPGEAPVLEEPEGPVAAKDLVARSKALDGFHYELVTTLPDGQRFTHKVWVEGENMRSEMENPGTNELMVALVNLAEDEVYLYQPDQKMAVKMKTSQSEVETATPQDYLGGYDLDKLIFVDKQAFDNKPCIVYDFKADEGTSRIWVWEDYGIPLKIEAPQDSGSIVMEFLDFFIGDLDENLFTIPEDTQIVDLES